MEYQSIELDGFKRFALNGTKYFKMTMTEIVQLILAKNGAGKSSLVDMVSPLPASAEQFLPNGSSVVKIIDKGITYVCSSFFGKKAHHSFIRGGDELNEGGTVSVQRRLVEEHLHYTQEIHDVIIGREKFSTMSAAARRKWFILFSPVKFDYALSVYGKLKDLHSERNGALRTAKKRLVAELSHCISEEEQQKLQVETEQLKHELDYLQSLRAPVSSTGFEMRNVLNRKLRDIESVSDLILRMQNIDRPDGRTYTILEINSLIENVKHDITAKEALIKKETADYQKLIEKEQILKKTGNESDTVLGYRAESLLQKRAERLLTRKLGLNTVRPAEALAALNSVFPQLENVFSTIESNETRRFTQAGNAFLIAARDSLLEKKREMANTAAKQQHMRSKMEAHRSSTNSTCPKCSYTWIEGYSEEQYQALLVEMDAFNVETQKIEDLLKEQVVRLAEFDEYRKLYGEYVRCTRNWPVLEPLWDHLTTTETVVNYPRKANVILTTYRHDLDIELDAQKYLDEYKELQQLILQAEKVGTANMQELRDKLESSSVIIGDLTHSLGEQQKKLSDYVRYRNQITSMLEMGDQLRGLLDESRHIKSETVETLRRETINKCITAIQIALGKKTEALNAMSSQQLIIADLRKHIDKYTLEEKSLASMIRELSPTEGLIADALMGSIKNFLAQMNNIIRKIWTYPLRVLECRVEATAGDELDYKFPVMVNDMSNVTPEVKLCSTAQKEVIDIVFKVTAMRHLGLGDSALILDEFGASFDIEHREQATHVIKSLMDTMDFSQLFMISHYEAAYGSFTNAQICVLDTRGVNIPSEYNQHVILK